MEAINYLLKVIIDTFLMVLVLRVWLQLVRGDFYNSLSQFIVKVSNPLVIPFRRVIPSLAGIDLPTIVLAYVISTLTFIIIPFINGSAIDIVLALYLGLIYLVKQTGVLIFIIMLVMALMSWVVQGYNPTQMIFHQLTTPVLAPIRRIIPSIAGLDLSVLIAFLLLNVINILLTNSLPYWAII